MPPRMRSSMSFAAWPILPPNDPAMFSRALSVGIRLESMPDSRTRKVYLSAAPMPRRRGELRSLLTSMTVPLRRQRASAACGSGASTSRVRTPSDVDTFTR